MATYRGIQEDMKERHGRTVKSCWIAHVKELNGPASSNRAEQAFQSTL